MRVLALDLGDRRIGLALSDPLGLTAQPAGTLERRSDRKDLAALAELVAERGVDRVVVGLPLLLSGEDGQAARQARAFAERMRHRLAPVEVTLWDERLTTVQAERAMIADSVSRERRRQRVDAVAAALLLQSYLDAQPRGAAEGAGS